MRCIEEDELEFGERKGSRMSKIMAFVPLSFSRSSASANSSVSLALVISIISYLHHAKSRNLPTAASPADAHKSCRCHEELCRHGWQRPSDALISTRDFLRLCTAAFFPKRRTCIQPLARHTRHSSGNMEHSHIWQAFWTHDSRVNLHISTDYDQRNGFGGLVTVLHGSSERSSSARRTPSFLLPSPWQFRAPCTAIGGT
jgi:hypothetical protein